MLPRFTRDVFHFHLIDSKFCHSGQCPEGFDSRAETLVTHSDGGAQLICYIHETAITFRTEGF